MKKKHCFYVLCLAAFLFGFAGCENPEQTELNIDNSQYYATIQGVLIYPAGTTPTDLGGKTVPQQTVIIDVPYSYYSHSTPGTKRFTAVTDNQGKFEFKIPVTTTPANMTLRVPSFQGKHYIFQQFVQEGTTYVPKFVEKDVLYQYGTKNITASAFDVKHENLILAYNEIGVEPEFQFTATYRFNVERIFYPQPQGPPYTLYTEWIPETNRDVVVEVIRDCNTHYYIGRSNSGSGAISINIPIKTITEVVHLAVTSNPFRGNLRLYEISDDQQEFSSEMKSGVFSTNGFMSYYTTLSALQPVTAANNVQFTFTAD
jgi:hypothetical protein